MRAITYDRPGGPEVLHLTEIADPTPGPGEVVIAVVAAGVNRADLLQREGHYPPPPDASPILGLEVSGTVAALGPEVSGWSIGDPCVALLAGGGYAQRVAVPAGQVLPPPPGVDPVTAAGLLEVAATVVSNLGAAGLRPGETLLVHGGAGGIGSFALPYAKALGATVIATAGSVDKLDFCRTRGADHAVSYREDWVSAVRDLTGGRGVDVILDVMGASYLAANLSALSSGGRLVVIGLQGGRRGELDLGRMLSRRLTILATTLRARPVSEKAAICARVAEKVWPLVADGRTTPAPQTRFPLTEAAAAHRHLASGENLGKVVLTVGDPTS